MVLELPTIVAMAVGALACLWDLRTRRIPNALTLSAPALAVVWFLSTSGAGGALSALYGWFVGLAIFLPFYLLGGMGAGDVKLMAALGAWLGPALVFWSALYAAIAGGVLAVVIATYGGYLRQALRNLGAVVLYWRIVGPRPLPALTLETAPGPRLAYALPILIGMVAAIWLR